MEQTSLRSGIRVEAQRVVVLPGDVKSPGYLQEGRGAVRSARLAAGFVLRRIPQRRDSASFGVERNLDVVVFVRDEHPEAPLLGHLRHPVSGVIVRRGRARGGRSSSLLRISSTLCRGM